MKPEMLKRLCPALLLLIAGCPMTTVVGNGVTGAATTTGGTGATSSGQASGGSGISASGSGTGGATSAAATTGGTSTGACGSFGKVCLGNSDCCSGACNGTCDQAFGQKCNGDNDCSSDICTDGTCVCTDDGGCAVDQDCCNAGRVCQQNTLLAAEVGQCCTANGAACVNDKYGANETCCAGIGACVNDTCQCQGPLTECFSDANCCEGKCKSAYGFGFCASGAGAACGGGFECISRNCVDGGCGTCSEPNGSCATSDDCCSGLVCADFPPAKITPNDNYGPFYTSYGLNCCAPNGLPCDAGADCCSEACDNGSCACVETAKDCFNDHACCSGGACMPWKGDGGEFACCQSDGESCFGDRDCCSGSCQDGQCGCVAAGGKCGLPGEVAPEGAQACCSGQCSSSGTCS